MKEINFNIKLHFKLNNYSHHTLMYLGLLLMDNIQLRLKMLLLIICSNGLAKIIKALFRLKLALNLIFWNEFFILLLLN